MSDLEFIHACFMLGLEDSLQDLPRNEWAMMLHAFMMIEVEHDHRWVDYIGTEYDAP